MSGIKYLSILLFSVFSLTAQAQAQDSDPDELQLRLTGSVFKGTYIRAGTPYTMQFGADGVLTDSAGRTGRWWVKNQQNYCRQWQDGPMAGVETCMEVVIHNQRIAIFNEDDMVLEGELVRP